MALTSKRPVLELLQVARGLAAILITAKHALYEVEQVSSSGFQSPYYGYYVLAIDIFFVLSGFIMIYTNQDKNSVKDAVDFIVRRIIRIVPLYWFYTFLLLAVAFVIPQVLDKAEFVPLDFLKSLFFVPYVNTAGDLQPFLAVGWSLNYEMYFYLVFAVFLMFPGVRMLLFMSAYYLFTVYLLPHILPDGVIEGFYTRFIVLEFLVGAWIGYLFINNIRLPERLKWPAIALAAFTVIPVFIPDVFQDITGMGYSRFMASIIIIGCLALPRGIEDIRVPQILKMSGDSSYTVYLSHAFFIGGVTQVILFLGLEPYINAWILFILVMLACVIGGWIFYLLFELPMIRGIKSMIRSYRNKEAASREKTI